MKPIVIDYLNELLIKLEDTHAHVQCIILLKRGLYQRLFTLLDMKLPVVIVYV